MKNTSFHKKNKIIVALSGGVDSAVTAAILKKQEFEVAGVFFRFFDPPATLCKQACSRSDAGVANRSLKKALQITKKLGIPLKIIDARKVFKKKIIDYFVGAYKKGLTPNPCVVCNKEMKFRLLFELLKKEKADAVATGHYARLGREIKNQKSKIKNKEIIIYKLLEAKDKTKDQSYFLYRLTQKDLAKIIFPLGKYKKSEVKKIAKKMKLPIAENESQDICFVADNDVAGFLAKDTKMKPGKIVDESGKFLGKHKGLPFYTFGQRKGIEIGGTGPYWVIGKNIRKNELIVTNNPKKLSTKKFWVKQVNWANQKVKLPLRAQVRARYRAEKVSAIMKRVGSGKWEVRSRKYLRAVTPGQSAVFYKGEEVLGGGIIIN